MIKTDTTMTVDELRETSHSIFVSYLEQRGWEVSDPHGWGESDVCAFDPDTDEIVPISLVAEFQEKDEGDVPSLEIDEVELERAKACVHAYIGEHPDACAVRFDIASMLLFPEHQGRIRHLVRAYSWEEQSPRAA